MNSFIIPNWPAPPRVKAVVTTRSRAGASQGPYQYFNLGNHVDDDPIAVAANRNQLVNELNLKLPLQFLDQVHGNRVINWDHNPNDLIADASYTTLSKQVCAILTADCLPIFICDLKGTEVAAIHAGWRGLLHGVIDQTVALFKAPSEGLIAWIGPSLGPCHFEIQADVLNQFVNNSSDYEPGFNSRNGRLYGDLWQLAEINLNRLKVHQVFQSKRCTYCQADQFYSYRHDQGTTGRFASLIWLDHPD